jgi:hypothetical protein
MAQESSQPAKDTNADISDQDKTKESPQAIELDDFDATEDDLILPPETELAKKVVVRRKIEMYWEKKRLQEQIGDFSEIDFDF